MTGSVKVFLLFSSFWNPLLSSLKVWRNKVVLLETQQTFSVLLRPLVSLTSRLYEFCFLDDISNEDQISSNNKQWNPIGKTPHFEKYTYLPNPQRKLPWLSNQYCYYNYKLLFIYIIECFRHRHGHGSRQRIKIIFNDKPLCRADHARQGLLNKKKLESILAA